MSPKRRDEPVGELTAKRAYVRDQNKAAVYVTVELEDEAGTTWFFEPSKFKFDLKRVKCHPEE
jgi:hypothetical protein